MKKPKRKIKYIVIHCTATPQTTTLESIRSYWKNQRGWGDTPGYHYLINPDGEVIQLLDEKENSYGVYAHNSECISIAYKGGVDKSNKPVDNRTRAQQHAMFDLIVEISNRYPDAEILGHRDFAGVKKACPSFDVKTWLRNYEPDLGIAA